MKNLYVVLFVMLYAGVCGQGNTNAENLIFVANGVSFEMVFVQGGTFTMGCTDEQGKDCFDREKPAHKVTIGDFYIGKYPVTQTLWKAVMDSTTSYLYNKDCGDCPIERISWEDAREFITKLNALTDKKFRLPTEAEWEFAARGGNKSKGYKYSGSNDIDEVAWYSENHGIERYGSQGSTHPVGTKKSNELGIYDMSGNVYEWCLDWYDKSYYEHSSLNNPKGPSSGSRHIVRGGSWRYGRLDCRTTYRGGQSAGYLYDFIGFRLVLE